MMFRSTNDQELQYRRIKEASWYLTYNTTVREMAAIFHVSKSAIHRDLQIVAKTDKEVRMKLEQQKAAFHSKGGKAKNGL